MNNDIILEICIAGLNCRAGYATAHDAIKIFVSWALQGRRMVYVRSHKRGGSISTTFADLGFTWGRLKCVQILQYSQVALYFPYLTTFRKQTLR